MGERREADLSDSSMMEEEDTLKDQYLTYRIADEDYGMEIQYVTEIIGIQKIATVPDMPAYIKGVINLRGQVIPVMDIRVRFGMKPRDYDERTCVVVVRMNEVAVGLVVDTVKEVIDIPEAKVQPPPKVAQGESARYIKGIGKVGDEVKILVNINRLLLEDDSLQAAVPMAAAA